MHTAEHHFRLTQCQFLVKQNYYRTNPEYTQYTNQLNQKDSTSYSRIAWVTEYVYVRPNNFILQKIFGSVAIRAFTLKIMPLSLSLSSS